MANKPRVFPPVGDWELPGDFPRSGREFWKFTEQILKLNFENYFRIYILKIKSLNLRPGLPGPRSSDYGILNMSYDSLTNKTTLK